MGSIAQWINPLSLISQVLKLIPHENETWKRLFGWGPGQKCEWQTNTTTELHNSVQLMKTMAQGISPAICLQIPEASQPQNFPRSGYQAVQLTIDQVSQKIWVVNTTQSTLMVVWGTPIALLFGWALVWWAKNMGDKHHPKNWFIDDSSYIQNVREQDIQKIGLSQIMWLKNKKWHNFYCLT